MLKHNEQCTGLEYMEETLSYLALQAWYDIDSAKVLTYCPLPINGEVHPETIRYVSTQSRTSPLSALYHTRYII
jgi:hypothetical protein